MSRLIIQFNRLLDTRFNTQKINSIPVHEEQSNRNVIKDLIHNRNKIIMYLRRYLVGGGIGMGKTCEPKAFSFQCMTKFTTNKKKKKKEKEKKKISNKI